MRKYFPALSNELSLPSSHRSFRGNRKPCGGGPAGVAARKADNEKAAVGVGVGLNCLDVTVLVSTAEGRARASAVRDLADAITVDVTGVANSKVG